MNKKINPWMIATIFLIGLILGFEIGRISVGPIWGNAKQVTPSTNSGDLVATDGTTNTIADTQTFVSTPSNTYDTIEKSLDATGHYSLGNKNAKVKIIEFSDFQCPYCHRFFSNTFPQIVKDYVASGKVYYSYYNFPLDFHPQAPKAAQASLCAGEQNKYWEYHDLLFENQDQWAGSDDDMTIFTKIAQALGLDAAKFTACVTSEKYTDVINKDKTLGEKKGISGTPTLYINNQKIVGAEDFAVFKKAIDTQL